MKRLKQALKRDQLGVMGRPFNKPTTNWDELKPLKQAWKRDRLGVLGVVSAVVAFALWASPVPNFPYAPPLPQDGWNFFTTERLPAIGAFLASAVILLLLRRR